jgi:hypothetical protein
MGDADDADADSYMLDLVDDAVLPSAGAVEAFELTEERLAHPVRVLRESAEDELDRRSSDRLG